MRDILNTYSSSELKQFISKTNIKGYSKMKKSEIIALMLKPENKDKFSNIQPKEKKGKQSRKVQASKKMEKPVPKPRPVKTMEKPVPKPRPVKKPVPKPRPVKKPKSNPFQEIVESPTPVMEVARGVKKSKNPLPRRRV